MDYSPESFDAVNALHIMSDPGKALVKIRWGWKPNGTLLAPTFVHGEGVGFRVWVRLMELVGFRTYHKWDARIFVEHLSAQGFAVFEQAVLGGSPAPLCCAAAKKENITGKLEGFQFWTLCATI